MEIGDFILHKEQLKSQVKSRFIKRISQVREQYQNSTVVDEIGVHSWFNNMNVENILTHLVQSRAHLRHCVSILPVFHHTQYAQIATKNNPHDAEETFLEWFLESMLESQKLYLLHDGKETTQFILPFLINQHYSIAVIKIARNQKSKLATIQYYNSFGTPLENNLQQQLKHFLRKRGFGVKYHCICAPDQQENHNCGIFICLKAIDMANENSEHPEVLLAIESLDHTTYHDFFTHYRYQFAHALHQDGHNVSPSSELCALM